MKKTLLFIMALAGTFLSLVSVILFLVACGQRGRDRPIQNLDILGPICH